MGARRYQPLMADRLPLRPRRVNAQRPPVGLALVSRHRPDGRRHGGATVPEALDFRLGDEAGAANFDRANAARIGPPAHRALAFAEDSPAWDKVKKHCAIGPAAWAGSGLSELGRGFCYGAVECFERLKCPSGDVLRVMIVGGFFSR